jgi:hypothetical protein
MEEEGSIVKELKLINKILTIAHANQIEAELIKLASTDDRKRMWILIDGNRMTKDISQRTGMAIRTVDLFLQQANKAGFIDNPPRKPPVKLINYTPIKWLDLIKEEPEVGTSSEPSHQVAPKSQAAPPPTQPTQPKESKEGGSND